MDPRYRILNTQIIRKIILVKNVESEFFFLMHIIRKYVNKCVLFCKIIKIE